MLTYSLGTQREEREDVDISKLPQGYIDVSAPGGCTLRSCACIVLQPHAH